MINIKMYCMCLNDHHLKSIKNMNYLPVGLGENYFNKEWIRDNTGENISVKNKHYGEYTFYYWFWKNLLPKIEDNMWIGFSGYRYHWSNQNKINSDELNTKVSENNFYSMILQDTPPEWNNYEVILGEELYINKWKLF